MKKYLSKTVIVAFTMAALSFLNACTKSTSPPTTCVTPLASDTVFVNQPLAFSSCTQGASSYLWNFGDNTTANTATVTHSYSSPGLYNVSFTPTNSGGSGIAKTFTILAIDSAGIWSFKGTTYNAISTFSTSGLAGLVASVTASQVIITASFFNSVPTANGTYVVSAAPNASNQVSLDLQGTGSYYTSTGGNGNNEFVNVKVNNGRISISGSGIELANTTNPADSSALNFNIHQTQ